MDTEPEVAPLLDSEVAPVTESEDLTEPENEWYTIGVWGEFPNYECRHCEFATLDLDTMEDHSFRKHYHPEGWVPEPEYDLDGNLITQEGN